MALTGLSRSNHLYPFSESMTRAVGELYELLSAPSTAWLPMVSLVFLLAGQPWQHYQPKGSGALFFGLTCSALTVAGLVAPTLAISPWLWISLTCSYLAWIRCAYFVADNHHYLIGYWCIAVSIAVTSQDGDEVLRDSATALIGMCFALAVVAKMLNRDYRSGSFFVWLLIFDRRVRLLASLLGGLTPEVFRRHAAASARVWMGVSRVENAEVPAALWRLAVGLTWWTIGIEAVVAAAFLWPWDGLDRIRVAVLIAFALSTFTFVAVPFFGQILLLLLLATTDNPETRLSVLALAAVLGVVSFCALRHASGGTRLRRRIGGAVTPPESKAAQST